jgi:cytochrome c1
MGLTNEEKFDKELYETLTAISRVGEHVDVNNMKENDATQLNQLLNNASNLLLEKYKKTNDSLYKEAQEGISFFLKDTSQRSSKERQQLWNQLLKQLPRVVTRLQGLE